MPLIPQPKYDVGHIFWVPRSRRKFFHETKVIDGIEYHRNDYVFEPYVKQKEVRSIYIVIDYRKKVTVEYNCIDIEPLSSSYKPKFNLPMKYKEEEVTNYSEEEAFAIAEEYAENKQDYYGRVGNEDYPDDDDD